jgi:hypothetical protein
MTTSDVNPSTRQKFTSATVEDIKWLADGSVQIELNGLGYPPDPTVPKTVAFIIAAYPTSNLAGARFVAWVNAMSIAQQLSLKVGIEWDNQVPYGKLISAVSVKELFS